MEFESPDVMRDFPGLYASEYRKKCNNDSDYSDVSEKATKKESSSRKKDKDKGYAALEGESSDDSSNAKSPSKTKKSKSFKFSSVRTKEKRDKSREKDGGGEKKKDRDKKLEKKIEKERNKLEKTNKKSKQQQSTEESLDIAEVLPVFGVTLEDAVQRARCHDGIDIPLPVRECIDFIGMMGLHFESIYKVSGTKSKVLHLKKVYNHHDQVNMNEYDVPTVTSLLKAFLRDLPEPLFTSDLLIRFEEAGAILTAATREKHLITLVDNLPPLNRLLLSWLMVHFDIVSLNEKVNKMSKHHLANALSNTFHCSSRLLFSLMQHSVVLFAKVKLVVYVPPLKSWTHLPDDPTSIQIELAKQESLLNQLHDEISVGCISRNREELLWDVQRIITQLKRKLKSAIKTNFSVLKPVNNTDAIDSNPSAAVLNQFQCDPFHISRAFSDSDVCEVIDSNESYEEEKHVNDRSLLYEKFKNEGLHTFREELLHKIETLRNDNLYLMKQLSVNDNKRRLNDNSYCKDSIATTAATTTILNLNSSTLPDDEDLDSVIEILTNENQIINIKNMNILRQIVEERELSIDLKAQILCNTLPI